MWTASLAVWAGLTLRETARHCYTVSMTKRLEDAIARLTPQQVDQLTQYVELLARLENPRGIDSPAPAQMGWVGALKNGPHRSGPEAQEAAKHYRLFLLQRGMAK